MQNYHQCINDLLKIADYFVLYNDSRYNIDNHYYSVDSVYDTTVKYIADKIYSYKNFIYKNQNRNKKQLLILQGK